jgi:hypothetical protein
MVEAATEPKVKGVAFRSIEACFGELRGEAARDRARERMPAELRALYQNGLVLASSWYPISWYRETFRAFRAVTNDGPELARQIGYQSVKRDMRSVYKALFAKIVSPQTLLGLSGRLFSNYYDTGSFDVVESRRGYVSVKLTGCVGWDHNMWTEVYGSCACFLEIAGAREVRLYTKSGGRDGDETMDLEAHWV